MRLDFGIHSPNGEDVFWQSWITAGICYEPYIWTPEYSDLVQLTDWHSGRIPIPAILDAEGNEITPQSEKPGWFANCRVSRSLAQEFTHGLPQTDEDGQLLDIFDRTWAAQVFNLTKQPANPETNFPAGWRNSLGVTYTDKRNILTPYNVWVS